MARVAIEGDRNPQIAAVEIAGVGIADQYVTTLFQRLGTGIGRVAQYVAAQAADGRCVVYSRAVDRHRDGCRGAALTVADSNREAVAIFVTVMLVTYLARVQQGVGEGAVGGQRFSDILDAIAVGVDIDSAVGGCRGELVSQAAQRGVHVGRVNRRRVQRQGAAFQNGYGGECRRWRVVNRGDVHIAGDGDIAALAARFGDLSQSDAAVASSGVFTGVAVCKAIDQSVPDSARCVLAQRDGGGAAGDADAVAYAGPSRAGAGDTVRQRNGCAIDHQIFHGSVTQAADHHRDGGDVFVGFDRAGRCTREQCLSRWAFGKCNRRTEGS